MEISKSLAHYGTPRHSGRYPWGSGENPYQRSRNFYSRVTDMRKRGLTDAEIAKSMKMSSVTLHAKMSNAKHDMQKEEMEKARKLKEKGYSNVAIGKVIGRNESQVRNYLKDDYTIKATKNEEIAAVLKDQMENREGYMMIGRGTSQYLENDRLGNISQERMNAAVELLKEQGYVTQTVKVPQMGTNNETTVKVLCQPDTQWKDVVNNKDKIFVPNVYSTDGETIQPVLNPVSVDSKRIQICYDTDVRPDGSHGIDRDGVIELRRGVDDISLGKANYAQVRIAVDGTHYLKGMAVYADDLPDGIDIRFNTNKSKDIPMIGPDKEHSVLKPMKSGETETNPFGATIKDEKELILAQRFYDDPKTGEKKQSAINIVSEEGDWKEWKKTISAQMLSKQQPKVAERQLREDKDIRQEQFDEIMSLTNPVVKKMKLEEFAEKCDSAAVDLKAAGFPRQASHVILPLPGLKENEIFAPNYNDGDRVVLIRYPHAGRFEIPELIVNNKNPDGRKIIGTNAPDAVGIHPSAAARLSGADFDGDTVMVIPNNDGKIKTMNALPGLKDFEPKKIYHNDPPNYPLMTKKQTQQEMGKITNLIADMQIKGAPWEDVEKAVKHSMVVIDAEKHELDYKRSYEENGIANLKRKYQGVSEKNGALRGASTLITKAGSSKYIKDRALVTNTNDMTKDEYDRYLNGEKIWRDTGRTKKVYDPKSGTWKEKDIYIKTTKMYTEKDAMALSSGYEIERIYGNYANQMKAMANRARKEALSVNEDIYNPTSAKVYAKEVARLNAALKEAEKNAPLEAKAQIVAGTRLKAWKKENPIDAMDGDTVKKKKGQFIKAARNSVGANKKKIEISDREWEAIQAGAISKTALKKILSNADTQQITKLAMPKQSQGLSSARVARAKAMANAGFTTAQIAETLGISTSTVLEVIK